MPSAQAYGTAAQPIVSVKLSDVASIGNFYRLARSYGFSHETPAVPMFFGRYGQKSRHFASRMSGRRF